MALIDFIEKLQRKPRHIRIQIMWVGTILGAMVIFAFWLWSLTGLLARSQSSKTDQANDKALQNLNEMKNEMPGLWQSLSAGISNVINTAKQDLNNSPSPTASVSPDSQSVIDERLPIE